MKNIKVKIDFEKLKKIIYKPEKLKIKKENSYLESYPFFLNYFESIKLIKKENFIIGSHFVYGWMPRVLNLNIEKIGEVLKILNKVKNNKEIINKEELDILKNSVNNSIVGVSKLLHLINPNNYAIWDSNIYKFIFNKSGTYGINKPSIYLDYISEIKRISKEKGYKEFHKKVENKYGSKITSMRAIEWVMFEYQRKN